MFSPLKTVEISLGDGRFRPRTIGIKTLYYEDDSSVTMNAENFKSSFAESTTTKTR